MRQTPEVRARRQQGTSPNLGGIHQLQAGCDRTDAVIARKIENIRRAEEGLNDANWANNRLRELHAEKASLITAAGKATRPPQLDAVTAVEYRRQADKLLRHGAQEERKKLLRTLVGEVKLIPQDLDVTISYRLPEAIMNGLVAGGGFEPPTFGL
jgi:hypothetical protein